MCNYSTGLLKFNEYIKLVDEKMSVSELRAVSGSLTIGNRVII